MLTKIHSKHIINCTMGWEYYLHTSKEYYFRGYEHMPSYYDHVQPDKNELEAAVTLQHQLSHMKQHICTGKTLFHLQFVNHYSVLAKSQQLQFSMEHVNATNSNMKYMKPKYNIVTHTSNLSDITTIIPNTACFIVNQNTYTIDKYMDTFTKSIEERFPTSNLPPLPYIDFSSYVTQAGDQLIHSLFREKKIQPWNPSDRIEDSVTNLMNQAGRKDFQPLKGQEVRSIFADNDNRIHSNNSSNVEKEKINFGVIKIRRGDTVRFYECTSPYIVVKKWVEVIETHEKYNMPWIIYGMVEDVYWPLLKLQITYARLIERGYISSVFFEPDIRVDNQSLSQIFPDNYFNIRVALYMMQAAALSIGSHEYEGGDGHFCLK